MKVHRDLNSLPQFLNTVITIGTFDGVHKGHQKIINTVIEEAKNSGGESIVITFHPHPRKIVDPTASLQLINTLEEKIILLREKGIDHLVVVPFDSKFASLSPEEYIDSFLVKNFNPHKIVIGYDHHFGKGRKGNYQLLEAEKHKWNYQVIEVPKHLVDEIAISSTNIRDAVLNSKIDIANRLLGYDFFFTGRVIHGDKLGRTIGYPTANLNYTDEDKIRLGEGVYAALADVRGKHLKGMLSIGKRPTLNDTEIRVEINLFDFEADIYDEEITVFVKTYLRPQEKYNNLEELKLQLSEDRENAIGALVNHRSS